jgi:hypothetical protein
MKLTAKQAAERLNISYVVASGLMSHLEDVGKAKIVEKIFHSSGKGKPTRVYDVEQNVVISFGDDIATPSVAVSEQTVEEVVAACTEAGAIEPVVETEPEVVAVAVPVESSESVWEDDEDEDFTEAA